MAKQLRFWNRLATWQKRLAILAGIVAALGAMLGFAGTIWAWEVRRDVRQTVLEKSVTEHNDKLKANDTAHASIDTALGRIDGRLDEMVKTQREILRAILRDRETAMNAEPK